MKIKDHNIIIMLETCSLDATLQGSAGLKEKESLLSRGFGETAV
jgi:hypothetical protein